MATRLTNKKIIEKLERVEDSLMMNKSDVRKQVEERIMKQEGKENDCF